MNCCTLQNLSASVCMSYTSSLLVINDTSGERVVAKVLAGFGVNSVVPGPGQVPGTAQAAFTADTHMAELAMASCKAVCPFVTCRSGRVVTGDQFISSKEVKERLIHTFEGFCAEMEGAAIAQAATLNNLPFVIIRAISDKADDSAEMDYPTFERAAAKHSAALVADLVGKL